jgi:hypothetical protein
MRRLEVEPTTSVQPGPRRRIAPAALVILGLAAAAALWTSGGKSGWASPFLRAYVAAWCCYFLAAVVVTRAARLPRWVLWWIVIAALGLRIAALETRVPLTTDYWRYLWDGRVAKSGINPYLYPPDAPELRHLRDQNWRRIWAKHIPTLYPPTAEALFAGVARLRPSDPELFRWVFTAVDVGCVLLLIALLRRTQRPPERVIWYAWCPLPITETAIGAHVDGLGLFLLLLAFQLAARRGSRVGPLSSVSLAAAVLAKGFALLALPFFVKRGGWKSLVWFSATCAVLLAPFAGVGPRLFGGLTQYLAHWETNSSVFLLISQNLSPVTEYHFAIARVVTTAAVLAFVVWLARRQKPGMEWLMGATFAALAAQLLVSAPTMPWYATWTTPLLCWWAIPGWVLFTLTLSLQYYARWLWPGDTAAHYALLWLGYTPVYALLIGHYAYWRLSLRRSATSRTA